MNELIKQLAKQARKQPMGNSWTYLHSEEFEQKFAELIVRECVDNVQVWETDSRNHISYMLKQHFGIEE